LRQYASIARFEAGGDRTGLDQHHMDAAPCSSMRSVSAKASTANFDAA
jgi:hypothetical protein